MLRPYQSAQTTSHCGHCGRYAVPGLCGPADAEIQDGGSFIGRKAVALRIQWLTLHKDELEQTVEQLQPIHKELDRQKNHEFVFTARFVQEAEQRQSDYLRGLEISKELNAVEDKLSHLDLFWLGQLDKQIEDLKKEIERLRKESKACSETIGRLETQLHTLEYEKLPDQYRQLTEREDTLQEQFTEQYQIAVGLPRYEQELKRLGRASVVAKNFGDQLPRAQNEVNQTQSRLFQARREYVQQFQPCSFQVEVMDNQEFDDERKRLEESELPQYREKIRLARESALEQFQNDFLSKLRDGIQNVQEQVKNLNRALKQAHLHQSFPQLLPMRMSGQDVERYRAFGLARPKEYLQRLQDAMNKGQFLLFQDAIEKILQDGQRLGLLPAAPALLIVGVLVVGDDAPVQGGVANLPHPRGKGALAQQGAYLLPGIGRAGSIDRATGKMADICERRREKGALPFRVRLFEIQQRDQEVQQVAG